MRSDAPIARYRRNVRALVALIRNLLIRMRCGAPHRTAVRWPPPGSVRACVRDTPSPEARCAAHPRSGPDDRFANGRLRLWARRGPGAHV